MTATSLCFNTFIVVVVVVFAVVTLVLSLPRSSGRWQLWLYIVVRHDVICGWPCRNLSDDAIRNFVQIRSI